MSAAAVSVVRDQNGSILVELALSLPLFILILSGISNYAFFIIAGIQLQEAASAGTAYATIPGNSTNIVGMVAAAQASAPQFTVTMNINAVNVYSCTPGGATVTAGTTCSGGGGPLLFAQVSTSATEYPVFPWVGMPASLALTGFSSFEVVP